MTEGRKRVVRLTEQQRTILTKLVRTGEHSAATIMRARVLLMTDAEGPYRHTDSAIATTLGIHRMTVSRVRSQFACEGLEATLHRKKPTGRQYRKLDGQQEAQLVTIACSTPPEGRSRWTMTLLAERLVELNVVDSIDPATVWRTLKKTT